MPTKKTRGYDEGNSDKEMVLRVENWSHSASWKRGVLCFTPKFREKKTFPFLSSLLLLASLCKTATHI